MSQAYDIDLVAVARDIWADRLLIAGIALLAALALGVASLFVQDTYRSEILVQAEESSSTGLAGLASQYSGLASLAGVSLPEAGSDQSQRALKILESRDFLTDMINRHEWKPLLFAAKSWNPISGEISYRERLYDPQLQRWTRQVDPPRQSEPSSLEAYEAFREILSIESENEAGFYRIAVRHVSPEVAKNWVSLLLTELNRVMMEAEVREAQASIDFLNQKIAQTDVISLRDAFYRIIEEETKRIMLATAKQEYLFRVIDSAAVAEEPASPNRLLWVVFGALLGVFLGLFVSLFKNNIYPSFVDPR